MNDASREAGTSLRPVAAWVLLLAVLTVAGAVWLNLEGGSYRDFSPAILVVAYAPAVAAIIVACFVRGGVGSLLRQLLRWRAGAHWYAIALFGPLVLVLLGTVIFVGAGGAAPSSWLVLPSLAAVPALLGPLIAGSLGEELGWRGFAQSRLQARWAALTAAVVVGVIWSFWHLWPALTPLGIAELSVVDIVQTFVRLVSTSIIYAWLYNSTGGALPVVIVAHAGHNVAIALMSPDVIGTDAGALIVAFLYAAAAVLVVVLTSVRTLARGRRSRPVSRPGSERRR